MTRIFKLHQGNDTVTVTATSVLEAKGIAYELTGKDRWVLQWAHAIFTCPECHYSTTDPYTAGVINDLLNECPECDAALIIGDKRAWCNLRHSEDCGWYELDAEQENTK